ncbi:MAG: hypothetical protein WBE97_10910, partial [Candidatus Acidiferrales bacterium]
GRAELFLNGKLICRTGGTVRLLSDLDGNIHTATGIASEKTKVVLNESRHDMRPLSIEPNEWRGFVFLDKS